MLSGLLLVTSSVGCAKTVNFCFGVPELSEEALEELAFGDLPQDYPGVERYIAELDRNCGVLD